MRASMTRTSLVLGLLLVACGGKSTTTPTSPKPPTTTFELGELTVFEGKDAMVKIHADGTSELGGHSGKLEVKPGETASSDALPITWKPGPVFKTDGTIEYEGKPVARVNADGTVMDLTANKPVPITITADKITFDKGSIDLAADGTMTLVGGEGTKPDKAPRVEGADTPGKRRTVLALVGLLLGGETKSEAHVEPGPGNTVAPTPPQPH